MSVRSKATGAAIAVAAPEAKLAAGAAGKAAGKRKPPAADPRKTAPGSKAAQQREAVEQIKANRKPEPEQPDHEHEDQGDQDHEHEDQGDAGGRFAPFAGMQAPATGGGFVLGLIGWALFRAYIGNPGQPSGMAGVKRLVLAKAFNKTSGGGGQ